MNQRCFSIENTLFYESVSRLGLPEEKFSFEVDFQALKEMEFRIINVRPQWFERLSLAQLERTTAGKSV